MTSFSDWVNANAGNEADVTSRALTQAQGTTDPNAIGNARQAGMSGQAMPTSNNTYGDFLKALQGSPSSAAGAMGGGANSFDAMLMQSSPGAQSQLADAQHAYDQQQNGIQSAYAGGQKNADTAGAAQQQAAGRQAQTNQTALNTYGAKSGWGKAMAAGGRGGEVYDGSQNAQDYTSAEGAKSRGVGDAAQLAKLRQSFENSIKLPNQLNNAVGSIFNPLGAVQVAQGKNLSDQNSSPYNMGGIAGSGFHGTGNGEGFGGIYTNDDKGFAAWLAKNGYDPTTGDSAGHTGEF